MPNTTQSPEARMSVSEASITPQKTVESTSRINREVLALASEISAKHAFGADPVTSLQNIAEHRSAGSGDDSQEVLTKTSAEKMMKEKLAGLPALNMRADPRWSDEYETMPDYFADQPPPSEGEEAFNQWVNNSHQMIDFYTEKANAAMMKADLNAYELYQRYGLYANSDGVPRPQMDPQARHLFFDANREARIPSLDEVNAFKETYPEKAAYYAIELNKLESQLSKNEKPSLAEAKSGEKTIPVVTEKDITSYIGSVANEADKAIAAGDLRSLHAAIDKLPKDSVLRARITAMLRLKGILFEREEEKTSEQKIDYEAIGKNLKLDEQRPPLAESVIAPIMGNFFGDADNPTLAGKLAARVYNDLIMRDVNSQEPHEALWAGDDMGKVDYLRYISEVNNLRASKGLPPFVFNKGHASGVDDFHRNGNTGTNDFEFYFNKSRSNWKSNPAQLIRGYVTIDPSNKGTIQQDFVDLTQKLYDAGIDFTAKATGYMGSGRRTDNMVFYISPQDQALASGLMKEFLTTRGIGKGHVLAAMPSAQDGLSWAVDPDQTQTQVWREVAGTTTDASFNSYVATRLMPSYLTRIANAHEGQGNRDQAKIYRAEALRARSIVDRLKPSP